MATFKLNGRDVEFSPGEMVLEAAARHGEAVPYHCYHPDLSRPANCRMCLVELVGAPKLIPSCQWPVNEKMEIVTDSEKVKQAQQDVMEFLLVNHPLDCPICDQAGECKLQQYAYLFGQPASAMEEPKVKLDKRKVLGPNVVLDQERCISCTRCIRFCEEVAGTAELAMVNRGNHSTIDRHPDKELDNPYSGNVVDMCPVGALTDRHFRFQARVWYVQPVSSTCTLCSRGCNVQVDRRGERGGRPDIKRIRSRRNPPVNKSWICDEGRYGHEVLRDLPRPTPADGAGSADVDAAIAAAGKALAPRDGAKGWLGVLASGAETNEELLAIARLAREVDPDAALAVPPFDDDDEDAILRRTDKMANRNGAQRLGYGTTVADATGREVVILLDGDLRDDQGLAAAHVTEARSGGRLVAFVARDRSWLTDGDVVLPLPTAYEKDGTIVNCEGVVQRVTHAVASLSGFFAAWRHAADIAAELGHDDWPRDADSWLAETCKESGFAGLDPSSLTQWGARLPAADGGEVEYLEEPLQLFSSAPSSFAEGEYRSFVEGSVPPPALHVAAGLPPRVTSATEAAAEEGE